jgi:hypothetical protein
MFGAIMLLNVMLQIVPILSRIDCRCLFGRYAAFRTGMGVNEGGMVMTWASRDGEN